MLNFAYLTYILHTSLYAIAGALQPCAYDDRPAALGGHVLADPVVPDAAAPLDRARDAGADALRPALLCAAGLGRAAPHDARDRRPALRRQLGDRLLHGLHRRAAARVGRLQGGARRDDEHGAAGQQSGSLRPRELGQRVTLPHCGLAARPRHELGDALMRQHLLEGVPLKRQRAVVLVPVDRRVARSAAHDPVLGQVVLSTCRLFSLRIEIGGDHGQVHNRHGASFDLLVAVDDGLTEEF